ncbi:hypothetical protein AB0F77_34335 [Streptomyces sp. NPDC026672]|uniref:hypothetical protein n=1 Tax=unclassified Streptomyces TaxID=2593676 RepID=UPI0033CF5073
MRRSSVDTTPPGSEPREPADGADEHAAGAGPGGDGEDAAPESGGEGVDAGFEGADEGRPFGNEGQDDGDEEEYAGGARRVRWSAAASGALLCLAGLAAALLRLARSAPALVVAAYALGAAVCALGAFLGLRGRTRRALWLLVGGVMVMALGDQFD